MMWKPKSVSTMPLISPFFMTKTVSSKGLTIAPRGNQSRSPPFGAEPGSSELFFADARRSRPVLLHLGQQRLGLAAGSGLDVGRAAGLGLDQDVAGAALLGLLVARGVLAVVLAQVVLGDADAALDRGQIQHQVLHRDRLGRLEAAGVGRIVVVGLQVGVRDLDLAELLAGVEAHHPHLAALVEGIDRGTRDRLRREGRERDRRGDLAHRDVLRQALREHRRAHALRGQQLLAHAAVGIAQLLELRVGLEQALQALLGRGQAQVARGGEDHPLVDQV